jgi:hypothetical protein
MNDELDLFGTDAYARSGDPTTSHIAAESVRMADLEARVYGELKQLGVFGATVYEMADRLDLPVVSVSPRFRPLVRKGKVFASHERRANPSGRKSIVWKVVT